MRLLRQKLSRPSFIPRDLDTLLKLHNELDAAVFEAYCWPSDLADEEIVSRLLELNLQRAVGEDQGVITWLRPELKPVSQTGFWKPNALLNPELIYPTRRTDVSICLL